MHQLYFGGTLVGAVEKPLFSDDTWYGVLAVDSNLQVRSHGKRIIAYMVFCRDWDARFGQNPELPPAASEFDEYEDLVESKAWSIGDNHGITQRVGCPFFMDDGEFSCRTRQWLDGE